MEFNIEFLKAKNGMDSVKVNDLYIHSSFNPQVEAQRLVEANYIPRNVHIIFGNGLGYLLDFLVKTRKHNETIIVIEPLDVERFKVKGTSTNVHYLSDFTKETLLNFLDNYIHVLDKVSLIASNNYKKLFNVHYSWLIEGMETVLKTNKVLKNTINTFSTIWLENFVENTKHIEKDYVIETLINQTNKPVVIASGGPSLNKQIGLIKQYREQIILVSSGSTINSLLLHDINPDFIVSIDGGEANLKHFAKINHSKTKLIYNLVQHKHIREKFDGSQFYFLDDVASYNKHVLKKYFGINTKSILGGGTVSTYSLVIGTMLTTNKVALIGQDLSYTNNVTHAKGNFHEKTLTPEYIQRRQLFIVEGVEGPVYTDHAFFAMKQAFEDLPNEIKELTFNCTEGGVRLNGFMNQSFEEFLKQNCKNENKEISPFLNKDKVDNKNFERMRKGEMEKILVLKALITKSLTSLEKNNLSLAANMNQKINGLVSDSLLNILMNEITIKTFDKMEENDFYEDYEVVKNKIMLQLMLDKIKNITDILERVE